MSDNSTESGGPGRDIPPVNKPELVVGHSEGTPDNSPKLAVLPKGSLDGPTTSPMPEPETRLRQWAIQNGYKVKNVHTHHHADLDTFFVIFEAGKGS